MAFIGLVFAGILVWVVGMIVVIALILFIIGAVKLKNGKVYPKVLMTLGLLVLIPFTVLVTRALVLSHMQKTENRKHLYYCLVNGEFDNAQKLVDAGVTLESEPSLNVVSEEPVPDGKSTLLIHFCSREDCPGVVEFLLKNGADLNRRTYVHEPEDPEHSGSAEYGFQHGDSCGMTPLMHAAVCGNVEAVELLLKAGADPNDADYCGMTALMYASGSFAGDDMGKIARLLVDYGADLDMVDHFGQTALMHAEYYGTQGVMGVFERK